jgi:hypothetical protein
MAQEPGEIKAHIKAEGESLKEDFEEIEDRVKRALDWKIWYRRNTAIALGGAAASGLLISLLIPRSGETESRYYDMDEEIDMRAKPNGHTTMPSRSQAGSRFHQVLDNTMSAIFGVANDTFQDFMSKAIPGFREHYSQAAQSRRFE